jgi:hypothetical protein
MMLATSATTFAPNLQTMVAKTMFAEILAAIVFGALAVAAGRMAFFQRLWVSRTLACVAALVTLVGFVGGFG